MVGRIAPSPWLCRMVAVAHEQAWTVRTASKPATRIPANPFRFSRFYGTVQPGLVNRQETQIVQSCK